MSLTTEDAPFVHFSRKQKAIAWVSHSLFDHITYRARHGITKGQKRRGGLGWLPERFAGAESRETEFLRSLDFTCKVVYDVGAFHGLMTLFFAARASQVIAFEPVRQNRERLADNVRLNRLANVSICKKAIGEACGTSGIEWDALTPGAARLVYGHGTEVSTIDREVAAGLCRPDFIKIDTEGFEAQVIRGAAETLQAHHPELFLEVHGQTIAEKKTNATEIVSLLRELGYGSITHVESGKDVSPNDAAEIAMRGHIYAHLYEPPTALYACDGDSVPVGV